MSTTDGLPTTAEATQPIVGERSTGGVHARSPVDASTRVRRRRPEVEAADAGLGAAEAGDRPEDQLLVELRRTTVDGTAVQVGVAGLELVRAEHPPGQDPRAEPRCPRLD